MTKKNLSSRWWLNHGRVGLGAILPLTALGVVLFGIVTRPALMAAPVDLAPTWGKVLIAGGYNYPSGYLSSTELYDPPTNSFAAAADTTAMNAARWFATATLLASGKVLIAGGYNGTSGVLSSTELYDPATNSFAAAGATAAMNTARYGATATLLASRKVLIAGGYNGTSGYLSSTELYDPATNSFAAAGATAAMNTARDVATATLLASGKVLIAGGCCDNSYPSLSSTELYDPATNSFAAAGATAAMNTGRYFATATLLASGKVLIAGGWGGSGILSSTELYDPATNTFAAAGATAAMNTARADATATLLASGKVLIAGGCCDTSGNLLSSTELYDPATNSFAAAADTAAMNTARYLATATLLASGKVLIAGGSNSFPNGSLSSTEFYDPATNSFAPAADTAAMNTARWGAQAILLPLNPSPLALQFPVHPYTPWTAPIAAVFDHSMKQPYGPSGSGYGVVTAFTGETGRGNKDGCLPSGAKNTLYGYKCLNDPTAAFKVNNEYVGVTGCGGASSLEYDNHAGIDYVFCYSTPLFPAVSGKVHYNISPAGITWSNSHALEIDPDGAPNYRVFYLHLSTYKKGTSIVRYFDSKQPDHVCKTTLKGNTRILDKACAEEICATCPADKTHVDVGVTEPIAYSGNFLNDWGKGISPHLHFEVDKCVKNCNKSAAQQVWIPVDPYGWDFPQGRPDPYDNFQGLKGLNVPLWSTPSPGPPSIDCEDTGP